MHKFDVLMSKLWACHITRRKNIFNLEHPWGFTRKP
jgi:hypothetical protein